MLLPVTSAGAHLPHSLSHSLNTCKPTSHIWTASRLCLLRLPELLHLTMFSISLARFDTTVTTMSVFLFRLSVQRRQTQYTDSSHLLTLSIPISRHALPVLHTINYQFTTSTVTFRYPPHIAHSATNYLSSRSPASRLPSFLHVSTGPRTIALLPSSSNRYIMRQPLSSLGIAASPL